MSEPRIVVLPYRRKTPKLHEAIAIAAIFALTAGVWLAVVGTK